MLLGNTSIIGHTLLALTDNFVVDCLLLEQFHDVLVICVISESSNNCAVVNPHQPADIPEPGEGAVGAKGICGDHNTELRLDSQHRRS